MSSKAMSLKAKIRNYAKDNRMRHRWFSKTTCLSGSWPVCHNRNTETSLLSKEAC